MTTRPPFIKPTTLPLAIKHKGPNLSAVEERYNDVLQETVKAHCRNGSWAGQVEELERVRADLTETSRILNKERRLKEHTQVGMVPAGLNAFGNVESLISEDAATGDWDLVVGLFMYSVKLEYLTTLVAGDSEEEPTRTARAKYAVQQVSNFKVSPRDASEVAKELINGYLAQMHKMVTQGDSALNLPSQDTLLAQGASKLINYPAALACEISAWDRNPLLMRAVVMHSKLESFAGNRAAELQL